MAPISASSLLILPPSFRSRNHLHPSIPALPTRKPSKPSQIPSRTHRRSRIQTLKCSSEKQSSEEFEKLFSNLNQSTMKHEPGSLTSAIFLVAGTTVGAGILSIPAVTQEAGFSASAIACILCWLYMVVTGLLIAEVNVNTMCELGSGGVSLVSMARRTLGEVGVQAAWTAIILGTAVPLALFLVWDSVILGSIPNLATAGTKIDPLELLRSSNGIVGPIIEVFSFLAIATSYIGFVLGFQTSLQTIWCYLGLYLLRCLGRREITLPQSLQGLPHWFLGKNLLPSLLWEVPYLLSSQRF